MLHDEYTIKSMQVFAQSDVNYVLLTETERDNAHIAMTQKEI